MTERTPGPDVESVERACHRLGISKQHGYALIARHEFPAPTIRLGRRVVVPRKALDELLGLADTPPATIATATDAANAA